jgi:hypothetical protein
MHVTRRSQNVSAGQATNVFKTQKVVEGRLDVTGGPARDRVLGHAENLGQLHLRELAAVGRSDGRSPLRARGRGDDRCIGGGERSAARGCKCGCDSVVFDISRSNPLLERCWRSGW